MGIVGLVAAATFSPLWPQDVPNEMVLLAGLALGACVDKPLDEPAAVWRGWK